MWEAFIFPEISNCLIFKMLHILWYMTTFIYPFQRACKALNTAICVVSCVGSPLGASPSQAPFLGFSSFLLQSCSCLGRWLFGISTELLLLWAFALPSFWQFLFSSFLYLIPISCVLWFIFFSFCDGINSWGREE